MSARGRLRLLAGLVACMLVAGCREEGRVDEHAAVAGPPAPGDTLVEASIGDITSLIPNIATDQASHRIGDLVYDGLVKTDKDLKYVPAMAESWELSKDCLTLTFKLRP
ncbi:MAG TPA: hypothetical protein VML54_05090, partial [Candidatus Limnocylindrales bacterium]|nr:hypothetical protein [Candidatus Limnocylindrales bacterium]